MPTPTFKQLCINKNGKIAFNETSIPAPPVKEPSPAMESTLKYRMLDRIENLRSTENASMIESLKKLIIDWKENDQPGKSISRDPSVNCNQFKSDMDKFDSIFENVNEYEAPVDQKQDIPSKEEMIEANGFSGFDSLTLDLFDTD